MKNLLIFTAGIGLAGFVGYKIGYSVSQKKYEHLADEEVASVKKMLMERYEGKNKSSKKVNEPIVQNNESPVNEKKQQKGKKGINVIPSNDTDYSKPYRTASEPDRIPGKPGNNIKYLDKEEVDTTKPYIITPEEFHDSDYECKTLFYCADKVLTDDDYNQITNIGIVGGYSILNQMGKYDADCLYVRDEKIAVDYEILLEERTFSQIRPLGVVDEY